MTTYYENQSSVNYALESANGLLQQIVRTVSGFFQQFQESTSVIWYHTRQMFKIKKKRDGLILKFVGELAKGDILISRSGFFRGMVGHAAIMATDYWVIEMPGGGGSSGIISSSSPSSNQTLEDNNRRISIYEWLYEHRLDSITVYRCPNKSVASMAATWAYTNYYNASGGNTKTIHIKYSMASPILRVTDPSYCSKLVIQAYYYGTAPSHNNVISLEVMVKGAAIVPNQIPSFFTPKYKLKIVQKF